MLFDPKAKWKEVRPFLVFKTNPKDLPKGKGDKKIYKNLVLKEGKNTFLGVQKRKGPPTLQKGIFPKRCKTSQTFLNVKQGYNLEFLFPKAEIHFFKNWKLNQNFKVGKIRTFQKPQPILDRHITNFCTIPKLRAQNLGFLVSYCWFLVSFFYSYTNWQLVNTY